MKTRYAILTRPLRLAFALLVAASVCLGLSSCGERIYSATVAGYVTESTRDGNGDYPGVNGAQVLVYTEDPAGGADPDAFIITSTLSSTGNDGYWSHKVMWRTSAPMFDDKGDSGTVWVKVKCAGYFPETVKVTGVLSDSSNVTTSIKLRKIQTTSVKGRVINENGAGVNGVRVILDLDLTTDQDSDFTATTATVDSVTGIYEFTDVPWEDEDSLPVVSRSITGSTATADAGIYIDDTSYYAETYRKTSPKAVTLASGGKLDLLGREGDWITVRSAGFSVPSVKGKVRKADGSAVAGVSVSYDLPSTDTYPDDTVKTDSNGFYTFNNVKWTDADPGATAANNWVDSEGIYVWIDDAAYTSTHESTNPLLVTLTSGKTQIAVPETGIMEVRQTSFSVSSVLGRVRIWDQGAGAYKYLNGIPLVLDLSSTSQQNDAQTSTQKNGSDQGSFAFNDVSWSDEDPSDPETEDATITVGSSDYEPFATTFTLEDGIDEAVDPITVVRKTVWNYRATIKGRCLYRYTPEGTTTEVERGIEGVEVTLAVAGAPANLVSTTIGNVIPVTDQNGDFQVDVEWVRGKVYVPQADSSGTGDAIGISVSYSSNGTAGNAYIFTGISESTPFTVKTFVNNGTNTLPEAVDTDPKVNP